jgi:hypothetical protein
MRLKRVVSAWSLRVKSNSRVRSPQYAASCADRAERRSCRALICALSTRVLAVIAGGRGSCVVHNTSGMIGVYFQGLRSRVKMCVIGGCNPNTATPTFQEHETLEPGVPRRRVDPRSVHGDALIDSAARCAWVAPVNNARLSTGNTVSQSSWTDLVENLTTVTAYDFNMLLIYSDLMDPSGGERGIRTPGRAFDPTTV